MKTSLFGSMYRETITHELRHALLAQDLLAHVLDVDFEAGVTRVCFPTLRQGEPWLTPSMVLARYSQDENATEASIIRAVAVHSVPNLARPGPWSGGDRWQVQQWCDAYYNVARFFDCKPWDDVAEEAELLCLEWLAYPRNEERVEALRQHLDGQKFVTRATWLAAVNACPPLR